MIHYSFPFPFFSQIKKMYTIRVSSFFEAICQRSVFLSVCLVAAARLRVGDELIIYLLLFSFLFFFADICRIYLPLRRAKEKGKRGGKRNE